VPQDPQFSQLIEQTLPLVKHIAFQVSVSFPRHVDREELVRAGVLGLVQAARRYDPAQGVPFARFADQRIRGAVLDAVRSTDWAPRSLRRSARTLEATTEALASNLGRSPTAAETAAALGLTPRALANLQEKVSRSVVLALDMGIAEIQHDEEVTLGDVIVDPGADQEEQLEDRELHGYLRDAVDLLPERHRLVIQGYFFGGQTSEELASELGVTISRISQIRSEAFEMLRGGITAQYTEEPAPARDGAQTARRKAAYAAAIAAHSPWRSRLAGRAPAGGPIRLAV
jgi:RNA polymerase sigma factor for flagellar operon FliA